MESELAVLPQLAVFGVIHALVSGDTAVAAQSPAAEQVHRNVRIN